MIPLAAHHPTLLRMGRIYFLAVLQRSTTTGCVEQRIGRVGARAAHLILVGSIRCSVMDRWHARSLSSPFYIYKASRGAARRSSITSVSSSRAPLEKEREGKKQRDGGGGEGSERACGGDRGVGLRRFVAGHEAPPGRVHRPGHRARPR
jgi:hypothetical protein